MSVSISDMVPQQNMDASRSDTPTGGVSQPLFGSQLVDKNSSTPYSDATQVGLDDCCLGVTVWRNSECWITE